MSGKEQLQGKVQQETSRGMAKARHGAIDQSVNNSRVNIVSALNEFVMAREQMMKDLVEEILNAIVEICREDVERESERSSPRIAGPKRSQRRSRDF